MKLTIVSRRSCLLSIAEVAWLLGVDNSQVCRAIRLGLLPVVRCRGRVLIPARSLVHLADDGRGLEPPTGTANRGGA
jgi:excisionase family DNA binding protein